MRFTLRQIVRSREWIGLFGLICCAVPLSVAGGGDDSGSARGLSPQGQSELEVEYVYASEPVVRSAKDLGAPVAPSSLTEWLAPSVGLVVQPGTGPIDPPLLASRGAGSARADSGGGFLVRMNGIPLNAADGSFDAALIEPAFFEGFQTLAAPEVPESAPLVLGGTIDLLGYASNRMAVTAGNDGLGQFVAQAGEGALQMPDYRFAWQRAAAVAVTRSDGWRAHSEQERCAALVQAAWKPRKKLGLWASVYGVDACYDLPGSLTLAQAADAPERVGGATAVDRPRRETQFLRLALEGDWLDGDRRLTGAVSVQQSDDWFRQLRRNGITATRGTDGAARIEGHWWIFSSGLLWLGSWREQERYANLGGATGHRFADLRWQAQSVTGWGETEWRFTQRLTLAGGVTWSFARREVGGTVAAASNYIVLSPRVCLTWRPRREWELFARYERGSEPPTVDDLLAVAGTPNDLAVRWTPLRRQRADTFELGVRHPAMSTHSVFEVTAYAANRRNELLRQVDGDGAAVGAINAGPTRHVGLETALAFQLVKGWCKWNDVEVRLAHNWGVSRFAGDPIYGHNRLAGRPAHTGGAELAWMHDHGPFAALGANWVLGRTFADQANQLSYLGYAVANMRLGWRSIDGWRVVLEIGNLFDHRTIAATAGVLAQASEPLTAAVFLPGRPRTMTVSFERRW